MSLTTTQAEHTSGALSERLVVAMITSRERARLFCGKLFYFVGHFCKRFSVHLHIDTHLLVINLNIFLVFSGVWCHTAIASQALRLFPFRGATILEA